MAQHKLQELRLSSLSDKAENQIEASAIIEAGADVNVVQLTPDICI